MLRIALASFMAVVAITTASARADEEKIAVSLMTPREDYLLGEPVSLDTVVRNVSDSDLSIWDAPYDGDGDDNIIAIYISREGGPPSRFAFHEGECMEGPIRELKKGDTLNHPVDLLFARSRPPSLAFKEAGTYTIKVVYPLKLWKLHSRKMLESNPVRVRIHEPRGDEAQVWSRIATDDVFDFVQFGDVPDADRTVVKLTRVFKDHPESQYRASYDRALRIFASRRRDLRLSPLERREFHEVLTAPENALFPEDRRLDASVTRQERTYTPLDVLLKSWSERGGIPLTASPELGRRLWGQTYPTVVLREEMSILALGMRASWVQHGDRYELQPNNKPGAASQ